MKSGRIGEVGQRELEKLEAKQAIAVLQLHEDHLAGQGAIQPTEKALDHVPEEPDHVVTAEDPRILENALRQEAYHWPRLVFKPLKRSGHIILDACAPEGRHGIFWPTSVES